MTATQTASELNEDRIFLLKLIEFCDKGMVVQLNDDGFKRTATISFVGNTKLGNNSGVPDGEIVLCFDIRAGNKGQLDNGTRYTRYNLMSPERQPLVMGGFI